MFLHLLSDSFLTHMSWSILNWILKADIVYLWSSLSVQLSPLWQSALGSLEASLNYRLYRHSSRKLLGSALFPSFYILALKLCLISKLGYCRDHLFPNNKDHCPSLTNIWCLENSCFIHFVHFFSCFQMEYKFSPYYILAGSGSVNSKLHFNVESYFSSFVFWFSFFFFFYLDDRFNVDIWGMTMAKHGKKLEGMSWKMGNIVKEKGKELGMEWEQAVKCQILEKGTDRDY